MAEVTKGRSVVKRVWVALAVIPAAVLAILVARYAVNVPFGDEWDYISLFQDAHAGRLGWDTFFQQHNESRQPVARAVMLGLSSVFSGDVRSWMAVSVILACITSGAVWILVRRTLDDPWARTLAWGMANLWIFSPVQHENWLMGLGFGQFMPGACLCVALAVAGTEIGLTSRMAVCMVLCLLSTFSFSGGMLCWVALAPVIWMMGGRRIAVSAAWVLMMGATLALYFHGYVKPAVHPSFWEVTRHPMRAAEYLLIFVGTPLSRGLGVATAAVFGGVVAAGSAPILWAVGRQRELAARAMPWLTLIGFGWINALAATAGRVGFGVEQAADSRYATFALPIVIGMVFLGAMLWDDAWRGPAATMAARGRMGWMVGIAAVFLVICYAITFSHGLKAMSVSRRMRLRGVAGLEFVDVAETAGCVESLYPNPAAIKGAAEFLNSIGYLRPALLADEHVTKLANRELVVQGSLQSVERTAVGGWRLAGTASIGSGRGRAADAVALAWKAPGKEAAVFMLAPVGADKTHIANGWQAVVRREMLPAEATRITIWAVDAEAAGRGGLAALGGAVIVERSGAMRMR